MAEHKVKTRKYNKDTKQWDVFYPATKADCVTTSKNENLQDKMDKLDSICVSPDETTIAGAMSTKERNKLSTIEEGANKYVHPDNESTRHVSDEQIARWNDTYTKDETNKLVDDMTEFIKTSGETSKEDKGILNKLVVDINNIASSTKDNSDKIKSVSAGFKNDIDKINSNISTITNDITRTKESLTSTISDVSGVKERTSKLEQTANSLKSTVSETTDKLKNIKIGARNLLRNSKQQTVQTTTPKTNACDGKEFWLDGIGSIVKDEIYTLTIWFSTNDDIGEVDFAIKTKDTHVSIGDKIVFNKSTNNNVVKVSTTMQSPLDSKNYGLSIMNGLQNQNTSFKFSAKFEVGNQSTDWSPAPEDIDDMLLNNGDSISKVIKDIELAKSEIKQTKDSIIAKVESLKDIETEFDKKLNGVLTKEDIEKVEKRTSNLEIRDDSITESVSRLETTTRTIDGKLKSQESRLSYAEQQIRADVITSTVKSTVKEAIDGQVIGGENLLLNSGYCKDLRYWEEIHDSKTQNKALFLDQGCGDRYHGPNLTNITLNEASSGWCMLSNNSLETRKFLFEVGKAYTISGLIWTNNKGNVELQIADGNSANLVLVTPIQIKQYGYTPFKFTFHPNKTGNENRVRFSFTRSGQSIFIPYVKLEEGTVATAWSDSTLGLRDKMAELKITADKISSSVSNCVSKSELQQTADAVKFDFKTNGGYNMIPDSKNRGGNNWLPVCWEKPNSQKDYTKLQPSYHGSDCLSFTQRWLKSKGGVLSKPIPVVAGETYTIAVDHCRMDRGSDVVVEIFCWDSPQYKESITPNIAKVRPGNFAYGGYQSKTFTIPKNTTHVNVYLWTEYTQHSNDYDYAHIFLTGLRMNKGKMALPWSPYPGETYDGITTVDGNGVKCDFSDGSHIEIGHDGFMWHKAGKKFPYYALIHTKLTNVTTADFHHTKDGWYAWKIQLPDEFKGKTFSPFCTIQGFYSNEGHPYTGMTVGVDWNNVNYSAGTFVVECKSINTVGSTTDYNINVLAWAIA